MKMTKGFKEFIESLEERIAPAGVVTITLSAGVLTITGDDADNRLRVSAAGNGQILIEPLDEDTDIGAGIGISRGLAGPVRSIVSNMGDGDDVLTISGFRTLNDVNVISGIGDDLLSLEDLTIKRRAGVFLGDGIDTLLITGATVRLGSNVFIDGGEDDNSVSFTANKTSVQGTLSILGGSAIDSVSTNANSELQLTKNATLNLGNGDNRVLFGDHSTVRALGSLSIAGGDAIDDILLAGDGASLLVRKDLTIRLGNGENFITQNTLADTISVAGTYRAIGGTDQDSFDLSGENFTAKNLILETGIGPNNISISAASVMLGTLSITGGDAIDSLLFQNANLIVNSRLRVDLGEGNNSVTFLTQNLLIKGSATFLSGDGDDRLMLTGNGLFSGPVTVDFKAGGTEIDPQSIRFRGDRDGFVFANSLTVLSSGTDSSVDDFTLQNTEMRGKVSISLGAGTSSAFFDDVYLRNSAILQTNDGEDTISFERSNFSPFDSLALKLVTILSGAGDDSVAIGSGLAGTRGDFRGGLSIIDSEGTDTINDVAAANLFAQGKPPQINGFENVET